MEEKVVSMKERKLRGKKTPKEKKNENEIKDGQETVYCSFCNRPNYMVAKMIQGPGVNICSECTMLAVQYFILEDKLPSGEAQKILDMFWSKTR